MSSIEELARANVRALTPTSLPVVWAATAMFG